MAKRKKSQSDAAAVGERLCAALTEKEIVQVLDALLNSLSPELQAQALARLGPDTRETVQQVLSPAKPSKKAKGAKKQPVSSARLRQTWSVLWKAWDGVIGEAAEEEGDYIKQDEDWEPPYFDESALVRDLEKIATKMRPLLQTAFEKGFSPDEGFGRAMVEVEEEVGGALPDWIEIIDGFHLEKNLSACLLEWEWLSVQAEGGDGVAFAGRILDWEDEAPYSTLDEDAFMDFFDQLPEADQEAVYRGLADARGKPPWDQYLKNTHSHWHALYMYYAETWAPEQYLDDLRATISQQWQNGLPVIEDFLTKRDYAGSLRVVEETIAALLKSCRREGWDFERELLFRIVSGWYGGDRYASEKKLLRVYQQTARGLGQSQEVKVLEIQRAAFNHFFNWDRMLKAFETPSVAEPIRQALFQSWQKGIVKKAKPRTAAFGVEITQEPWWLNWLLESIWDAEKGPVWFHKKMDVWLTELPQKLGKSIMGEQAGYLRLLTNDLKEINGKKTYSYPKFHDVVIRSNSQDTPDEKSRRQYLKTHAPKDLRDRIMAFWKAHLPTLVPSPKDVQNADYTEHSRWMAALKELAPQRFEMLLKEWRVVHERRRNLWQAMTNAGLV